MESAKPHSLFNATIIICSLGYFVDIYDLILFSIVRIPSLQSIGVETSELMSKGVTLLNLQMGGMLVGGLLWGIMGDRKGRVSVLYGSILLYSLANIANAFVTTYPAYAALRFLAGVGLAGELGAAVTLVSELMPKARRGYGVALVASVGILGAIFAAFVSEVFSWQTAYLVGGAMGLSLLVFRMKMKDSILFETVRQTAAVQKGNFFMFFTSRERFLRYVSCIFIGAPNWFIIGVLVMFAPEITASLSPTEPILVAKGVGWLYLGLSLGDLASGFLSQWIGSRRKVVLLFLTMSAPVIYLYLTATSHGTLFYYALFFVLGICNGYWAVMITIAAEQFGTNLRATAATTVPNFVRAMVIPLTLSVQALHTQMSLISSVAIVAVGCLITAYLALYFLEETHGRDLNFLEGEPSSQSGACHAEGQKT
jgi:putative MFS transporter